MTHNLVAIYNELDAIHAKMHELVEKITYDGATRKDEKEAMRLVIHREDIMAAIRRVHNEQEA